MNTRLLLFGAVLLAACSQKLDGPPATQCDDGLAVATSNGWQCTPTSQLAVGSVSSADSVAHADSARSAGQVNAASDAGVAFSFANDAHIWLGSPPSDPTAKVSLSSRGLELDSHAVPAELFRGSLQVDFQVPGPTGASDDVDVPFSPGPGSAPGLLRIRASGRLIVSKDTLCRVVLQLDGRDVASTVVKASPGMPRSWYVEGEGPANPLSGSVRAGVEIMNQGATDTFCNEGRAFLGTVLPYVVVEAMNHAE